MPPTLVLIYCEADGTVPLLEWMDAMGVKAREKCLVRIERLRALGHELRRPEADLLKEGIHELRASYQGVHYRLLYFFDGPRVVLSHGVTKERQIPAREIALAARRKRLFEQDRIRHTYRESE